MADITKCNEDSKCKKKDVCYRSLAEASMIQSYSNFKTEGNCNSENNYPFLWVREGENNETN